MNIPQWIKDAATNAKFGLVAAWHGLHPAVQVSVVSTCIGFLMGVVFAKAVL